jgi:hypothetical protein
MPELLHVADFVPHLHSTFRVETPIALELELAGIDDLSNAQMEQFSLEFTGPESPWLRQGTYKLHHAKMGEPEIFLVPLGPREGKMRYQAIFSRLTETAALKSVARA